ncbi:MAG: methyltransferase [Methylobacterium sp.]|nr:methyltransferase [Methylobacterium sp.]MCA3598355.1 methyltransferase [Methylobacterium sp.]MCA3604614.1 methyltransferase [Methylobacterium sp.]MCA3606736.1 methyltransferase [Methylobacterium sp.]MCA3609536.1 methyltransferase [Methylobacterium sp.]
MAALADRFYAIRDRVAASPRFQRFAARFPLTRPVATRQASAVFDLCAGFVYAQILRAAVDLRLLERLREGARTPADLAPELALSEASATRLLKATTSLGLTAARRGGRYGLGMKGAALLGNPGALRMIEHHHLLYADLADPVRLLRGEAGRTALQDYWGYATAGRPEINLRVEEYSSLMAGSLSLVVEDVLAAYPFAQHRVMLDIGGGTGGFIRAVAAAAPDLGFQLFDLPPVCELAGERFAEAGITDRVTRIPGNARLGPMPRGADLATLIRVLHDHDDGDALAILKGAFAALPPGGTLLIAEPMSGQKGAEAVADAYFGFYLLAMGSGRTRTPGEIRIMLETAGFEGARNLSMPRPLLASGLVARKPA